MHCPVKSLGDNAFFETGLKLPWLLVVGRAAAFANALTSVQLEGFQRFLESQGHNLALTEGQSQILALTVLYVPCLLDGGSEETHHFIGSQGRRGRLPSLCSRV